MKKHKSAAFLSGMKSLHRRIRNACVALILLFVGGLCALNCRAQIIAATVQIGGTEQRAGGVWDSGTVYLTINGKTKQFHYAQYSTAASLASAFGALFSEDSSSPVYAQGDNSGRISIVMRTNALTQLVGSVVSDQSGTFSAPSFSVFPQVAQTSLTMNCVPNPIVPGSSTSCYITLFPATAGVVNFNDGSNSTTLNLDASGNASIGGVLSGRAAGTYTLTANYGGDSLHQPASTHVDIVVSATTLPPSSPPCPVRTSY